METLLAMQKMKTSENTNASILPFVDRPFDLGMRDLDLLCPIQRPGSVAVRVLVGLTVGSTNHDESADDCGGIAKECKRWKFSADDSDTE